MAIPTNIIATPDNSLAVDLPRAVTITGTDIFERPYSTENEEFTQIAPDVLVGDWQNGAAKVDALIGQGVQCNADNQCVDIQTKIPSDIATARFIGFSFFLRLDGATATRTYRMPIYIGDAGYQNSIFIQFIGADAQFYSNVGNSVIKNTDVNLSTTIGTISREVYHHYFCYIDLDEANSPFYVFIDGVQELVGIGATNNFAGNLPLTTASIFKAMNGATNDRAVDGVLCDLHISTDVNFKNELAKYSNLPTIEAV